MSDLVVSVRQISNYPALASSDGTENVLVQLSGLGGPYATLSTADLVATALGHASMGIGTVVPADASAGNLLANPLVLPLPQASILWNAYDAGGLRYVTAGVAAALNFDAASGFDFVLAPAGNPGAAVIGAHSIMQLTLAGNLSLPFGTLTVARDPAAAGEVATLNYVSNHTVASFNARNGQVQLNASDVYAALCLTDPLATQPWVTNAINQSIQNLLTTCPLVNRWNNRTGSVYLMLADIECVFFQSGQQPSSPSFDLIGSPDPATPTDSPLRIFGNYQHGIITDPQATFASGALIETQPGRNIVWLDGVGGEANIIASSDRAGNVDLLINTSGTGAVYAMGLTTLNQTRIQAGQSAGGNVILLTPTVPGGQPQIAFEGQDPIVTGEIWNKGGGPIIFINQSGVRWATAPTDPTDLTNKAYVDARIAVLEARLGLPA